MDGKAIKIYKQWWFWMAIVLILFGAWCLATKDDAGESGSSTDEIVLDLEKILGIDSLDTDVKSTNARTFQEEYGITCFEGTSAAAYIQAFGEAVGGMNAADTWEEDDLFVYESVNSLYYIYMEAYADTDEICYLQVSIFDWEEAGENTDVFEMAAELLGCAAICGEAQEDIALFYEDLESFASDIAEGSPECTYTIIYENACIGLFTDDYGYPTCEIFAYETGD